MTENNIQKQILEKIFSHLSTCDLRDMEERIVSAHGSVSSIIRNRNWSDVCNEADMNELEKNLLAMLEVVREIKNSRLDPYIRIV